MSKCKFGCKNGKVYMEALKDFVDCPECQNITKVLEKPQEDGSSIFDKLSIPLSYKAYGTSDHDLFNPQSLAGFTSNSINDVGHLFERINKDLYAGKVTNISTYIYTSNLVDNKRFVYGAQKLALEKGLGVTPFISLNTLYGLQRVGDYNIASLKEVNAKKGELKDVPPDLIHAVDGYRVVQSTDLTYFDFINADVCFVEATANTTEKGWTGLADLLGERSKKNLPTFVIGYWGSKGGGTNSKGLRYLLAPEGGSIRLDLLVPYELKSRRGNEEDDTHVQRMISVDSTKSSVTAGLNLNDLMG